MGCWAAPFKTEQAKVIQEAMKAPLSKEDAPSVLYNVVGDDTLYDRFEAIPDGETDDVRPAVMCFLQGWFGYKGDDSELLAEMGFVEQFESGAMAIFKEMLTAWEKDYSYPS